MFNKVYIVKKLKNKYYDEYIKNILTIASGVFITQILTIILSPIFTRIYNAEAFGIIGMYLSIVNILTVVVTLRYDNAIVLPKEEDTAKKLFNSVIMFVIIFIFIFQLIILIFLDKLSFIIFDLKYKEWLYLLPIFTGLNGFFYLFRNWIVRKKRYILITKSGIYKSMSLNSLILLLGLFNNNPGNFLIANLVAQFVETFYLFYKIKKEDSGIFSLFKALDNLKILAEYKNFPKYSLPSDLLNVYVSQNPIILFSLFFGPSTVGYFVMTQRILGIPIKLISSSTLEVFKQKCSEDYNNFGNFESTFLKTFKYLAVIAIVPSLLVAFFSPYIFSIVLGKDWEISGQFARYLSLLFFFQFSVSPLGFSLIITNRQKVNLIWQIFLMILTSIGIYIGYYFQSSNLSVLLYSIFYSLMYLFYFVSSYNSSKGK
ncbi:lipopolysaccharide biosynthesis protein [Algoriphagus taiwanensis]|uniref:Lipopolysaccharide biosynthesis protein n=1 Tax=Algoriphagus taiwanensis TaxID=1445656 RepID=A0ABQ6Q2V0_9BACT|nr:lipopolysaccharide biosynthesis protein [Algoriphagus taiwanensis]